MLSSSSFSLNFKNVDRNERRDGPMFAVITKRLELPTILLVVCTDSYSLYKCLVKLRRTKEKRLIIDIMALR